MEQSRLLFYQQASYVAIAATLLLYLTSGFWLFGVLCGASILAAVVLEIWVGIKKHGLMHEIKETASAIAVALLIWFGAGFLLQTSSPLNAVVSCSMLPNIQRGDLVLIAGWQINAPQAEIKSVEGLGNAAVFQSGQLVANVNGSIYSACAQNPTFPVCKEFLSRPQDFIEVHGEVAFGYERCEIFYPKSNERQYGPCVRWVQAGGKKYYFNASNDVVVYWPKQNEYYAKVGDIIHRAYLILKAGNQSFVLTKGDNNPVFDVQVAVGKEGNLPVEMERIKGKVIFSIPVVGYLKLFISPAAILTPEGCDRYLVS
ncbi:MAG: hypothetical protein QXN37_03765 [Candidatus Anstonellaceae archaeon]